MYLKRFSKVKRILVATDGSESATTALKVALDEFYEKGDSVQILTVTDISKTYLPKEYHPTTLQDILKEDYLNGLNDFVQCKVNIAERPPTKTTKDVLLAEAANFSATHIFLGWVGRKGPKE